MKLYSVSILASENLEQAIQKIHLSSETDRLVLSAFDRDTQIRNWAVWEPPQSLMGNYRTLRLYSSINRNTVCKVEGPGFLIDELYRYFSK